MKKKKTILINVSDDGETFRGKTLEKEIFGEMTIGDHLFYFTKNPHIWSEKKFAYIERLVLTCAKTTRKVPRVHGRTKKEVLAALIKEYGSLKKLGERVNKAMSKFL